MPAVRVLASFLRGVRSTLAPALLALAAAPALGVPFAVQIGPERVVLDTPPGFSDAMAHGSPRLNELAEMLTSPSNKILVFAISDADMRRFNTGERLSLRRYMLVATPKGMERTDVATEDFQRIVIESLRELGKPPETADYMKFLEEQPVGRAHLLKELRREPAFVSILQGSKLPPDPRIFDKRLDEYMLQTVTVMLARGRALNLSVYTGYGSQADLDWLADTTRWWVEELRRLNRR
jgi:hypothetical protein